MNDYYKYWGKSRKCDDGTWDYHLLAYHSLDVAAVGEIWLRKNLAFWNRASQSFALSQDVFKQWFLFFLALHDIGKFSILFQNLCPELREMLLGKRDINKPYHPRHDQRGLEFFSGGLIKRLCDIFSDQPDVLLLEEFLGVFIECVFGHHGEPVTGKAAKNNPDALNSFFNELCTIFLSKEALGAAAKVFTLPKAERKRKTIGAKHVSWQLAGVTSLCDWIASGDKNFVYCKDAISLSDYYVSACEKAVHALDRVGVIAPALAASQGLERLFPDYVSTPTPLQGYCNNVPVTGNPQLWILEDVTGAGKTEAALTLASRIMGAGGGDGCFVALPTMATANAMYERMASVYCRLYKDGVKPSLVLSHGSRHLSKTFRSSYENPFDSVPHDAEVFNEESDEGKAHCALWLADSSKKTLLGNVGVGTIDQVLLAGLPVRYQSLRFFGLSRKVLIVDEVHAYDAYMLRLLENIIAAQVAGGGSVILLSATLPSIVREKMCKAYGKWLGHNTVQPITRDSFPLVTSITPEGMVETPVATRDVSIRDVAVKLVEDSELVVNLIRDAAHDGKCVCWIRNTVGDVRDACLELEKCGLDDVMMFHSRFALHDRLEIEKKVVASFGKDSSGDVRQGRILIASQVVEQSLDLDFDVMISDLAPIDLLIQRAGRLHRHDRGERGKPTFHVLIPQETESPGADWFSKAFPGARWVYQDPAILWRTKEVLKCERKFMLPDRARAMIEAVYSQDEALDIPEVFMRAEENAWGKNMAETDLATFHCLKFDQGYSRLSSDRWEEEERAMTRLADASNTVYLCRWVNGEIVPFYNDNDYPWDESSLNVRQSALRQISYGDDILEAIEQLKGKRRYNDNVLFLIFNTDDLILEGLNGADKEVVVSYSGSAGLLIEKG